MDRRHERRDGLGRACPRADVLPGTGGQAAATSSVIVEAGYDERAGDFVEGFDCTGRSLGVVGRPSQDHGPHGRRSSASPCPASRPSASTPPLTRRTSSACRRSGSARPRRRRRPGGAGGESAATLGTPQTLSATVTENGAPVAGLGGVLHRHRGPQRHDDAERADRRGRDRDRGLRRHRRGDRRRRGRLRAAPAGRVAIQAAHRDLVRAAASPAASPAWSRRRRTPTPTGCRMRRTTARRPRTPTRRTATATRSVTPATSCRPATRPWSRAHCPGDRGQRRGLHQAAEGPKVSARGVAGLRAGRAGGADRRLLPIKGVATVPIGSRRSTPAKASSTSRPPSKSRVRASGRTSSRAASARACSRSARPRSGARSPAAPSRPPTSCCRPRRAVTRVRRGQRCAADQGRRAHADGDGQGRVPHDRRRGHDHRDRGTWIVSDRCDGTLTEVGRGKVVVRDTRLKKDFTLRSGQGYLARAQLFAARQKGKR